MGDILVPEMSKGHGSTVLIPGVVMYLRYHRDQTLRWCTSKLIIMYMFLLPKHNKRIYFGAFFSESIALAPNVTQSEQSSK